jgi:transposase
MPAPYSQDLRLRVMDAVRSGMTYEEVTRRFRVSNSSILRWVRRLRESGSYAALPMGGKKPFVLAEQREWLLQRLAAKPDLTLRELLSELHGRGISVSYFALWHIVRRAGLRFKKRPCTPASRIGPTSLADAPGGVVGCNV